MALDMKYEFRNSKDKKKYFLIQIYEYFKIIMFIFVHQLRKLREFLRMKIISSPFGSKQIRP